VQRARAQWKIPPGSGEGSEYALRRAREASLAAKENAIPRGKGGDAAFARLIGRASFRDVVLRPLPPLPAGRLMS
jgi:hypothetical protein